MESPPINSAPAGEVFPISSQKYKKVLNWDFFFLDEVLNHGCDQF